MRKRLALVALALLLAAPAVLLAQPVPAAPSGPPSLPKDVPEFQVAQLNPFTWYGRFGYTNCAFVDTADGVLVVDTGWTKKDGENLKAQIAEKTKGKPVRWIVMTQTDVDSNGGIEAFLPTDATVFVHGEAIDLLSLGLFRGAAGQKKPTLVGVSDRVVVNAGGRRIEIVAQKGRAHSEYDLVVFNRDSGIAWVGDLVTPGRCPNLGNPAADPKGWLSMLDAIHGLDPVGVVPTRGDATKSVNEELGRTRAYIERVLGLLADQKAKEAPEARVAAELSLQKIGDYCPITADNANVLALYRRMQPDGSFAPPAPLIVPPKPAAGTAPAPR